MLKMQDFLYGLSAAYTVRPAETAGRGASFCRVEG